MCVIIYSDIIYIHNICKIYVICICNKVYFTTCSLDRPPRDLPSFCRSQIRNDLLGRALLDTAPGESLNR